MGRDIFSSINLLLLTKQETNYTTVQPAEMCLSQKVRDRAWVLRRAMPYFCCLRDVTL